MEISQIALSVLGPIFVAFLIFVARCIWNGTRALMDMNERTKVTEREVTALTRTANEAERSRRAIYERQDEQARDIGELKGRVNEIARHQHE